MDPNVRKVILTHQFYTAGGQEPAKSDSETIQVGGLQNVDVSVLEDFDYAALGHIHRAQSMGKEKFRYCGTMLKYSVSEQRDQKTLTMVTLGEKGSDPEIREIPLTPKRDLCQRRGTLEEVLSQATKECTDYVSVILTDEVIPYQARERLEAVYPNLLEIRIENSGTKRLQIQNEKKMVCKDPVQVFQDFFEQMQGRKLDEREKRVIDEVFQEAKEEKE